MTSGKVSSSNRNDLMAYMKTETTKQDEYLDKLETSSYIHIML
jgi:hypothetical protein